MEYSLEFLIDGTLTIHINRPVASNPATYWREAFLLDTSVEIPQLVKDIFNLGHDIPHVKLNTKSINISRTGTTSWSWLVGNVTRILRRHLDPEGYLFPVAGRTPVSKEGETSEGMHVIFETDNDLDHIKKDASIHFAEWRAKHHKATITRVVENHTHLEAEYRWTLVITIFFTEYSPDNKKLWPDDDPVIAT